MGNTDGSVIDSYGRKDRRARVIPTALGWSFRVVTSASAPVSAIPTGIFSIISVYENTPN